MSSLWVIPLLVAVLLAGVSPALAQVKAFPTAEGFGAATTIGGRGGRVIEVTNLNDDRNPGSFRYCAENTGPRTCVFRIGGTIHLTSTIYIAAANSYLTVAGQTAPGEGIAFTGYPIYVASGGHQVMLRFLRHRQGYDALPPSGNNDCGAFFLYGDPAVDSDHVHHVILDHLSAAYACDDTIQLSGRVSDVTVQWSLIGDGYTIAADGFYDTVSKGMISGSSYVGGTTASVHHNLFVHNAARLPNAAAWQTFDWRNNSVYNWSACNGGADFGTASDFRQIGFPSNVNFVGNKYIKQGGLQPGCGIGTLNNNMPVQIWQHDNNTSYCPGETCPAQAWEIGWIDPNGADNSGIAGPASAAEFRSGVEFVAPPVTLTPVGQLDAVLLANAGTTIAGRLPRDAVDRRLIEEWQSRTGDFGRGGAPNPPLPIVVSSVVDTDRDGMPDSWETARGLNPSSDADGPQCSTGTMPACYTWLEVYLNELAGDGTPVGPALVASAPPRPPRPRNLRVVRVP